MFWHRTLCFVLNFSLRLYTKLKLIRFVVCFESATVLQLYRSFTLLMTVIFRNALLEGEANKLGGSLPAARKTGTTICGVVFKVSNRKQAAKNKKIGHKYSYITAKAWQVEFYCGNIFFTGKNVYIFDMTIVLNYLQMLQLIKLKVTTEVLEDPFRGMLLLITLYGNNNKTCSRIHLFFPIFNFITCAKHHFNTIVFDLLKVMQSACFLIYWLMWSKKIF